MQKAAQGRIHHRYINLEWSEVANARTLIKALGAEIERLTAENERLRARVTDAEIAIGVWDDTRSSEYWLRYPHRINQQLSVNSEEGK